MGWSGCKNVHSLLQACQTSSRSAQGRHAYCWSGLALAASVRRVLEKNKQMHRKIGVAGAAGYVAAELVMAFSMAGPSRAQALTDPAAVAATPAAQAAAAPAAAAEEAAASAPAAPAGAAEETAASAPAAPAAAAPYAPASAEPAVPPPAMAPVVDPILEQVRQHLAQPARGAIDRTDRAALVTFYAESAAAPLWVGTDGFNARARHALAEIRKAEDWGLSAAAFDLPQLAPSEARVPALAAAEVKLSLAALLYARHARGGRLDPAQVSRSFDQKPTLIEPKDVLAALATSDTPGTYLQGLNPKHPQFERLRQALLKAPAGGHRLEPAAEPAIELPNGPTLRPGMEHPHVAFLRQRLDVPAKAGERDVYDEALAEAVMAFQRQKGFRPDGVVSGRTRAALNSVSVRPTDASPASDLQRSIIANMERWRWMTEDVGKIYVWDHIAMLPAREVTNGQV